MHTHYMHYIHYSEPPRLTLHEGNLAHLALLLEKGNDSNEPDVMPAERITTGLHILVSAIQPGENFFDEHARRREVGEAAPTEHEIIHAKVDERSHLL